MFYNLSARNNNENGRPRTESDRLDVAGRQKDEVGRWLFRFVFWVRNYYCYDEGGVAECLVQYCTLCGNATHITEFTEATNGMSKYRLTPYKPTIVHNNC